MAQTPLYRAPIALFNRIGIDILIVLLAVAVVIGALVPDVGKSGGVLRLDLFTNYGVSVVFLLYGLTLSWQRLRAGAMNWRLHLVVLSATFLFYPVVVLGVLALAGSLVDPNLKLGFFYLAASPSTVAASVAMTSIAHGNVAGAVFNASMSSLVGVIATPLWVHWYMAQSGQSLALGPIVLKVAMLVAAPIAVGQAARPILGAWIERRPLLVKVLDRATIVAIVFNSFSDSVAGEVWKGHGLATMAPIAAASLVLLGIVFGTLGLVCRIFGFVREDRVAAQFCGTKKSLVSGLGMAKAMFGASPTVGAIVLPFVIYHFLQLIGASLIARHWARDAEVRS